MISDHRVKRIDRLVEHSERRTADKHIDERRNDTVSQVLCDGLYGGLDDAFFGKRSSVAADIPRDGLSAFLDRLLHSTVNMLPGFRQAFSCKNQPAKD